MESSTIQRLHDLSCEAMSTGSMERYHRVLADIDDLVFHGYGIADREAYQIWEELHTQKSQTVLPGF
jgi:1-aminocyclopropane-1-carboxylate deaminase/D-cysteine desulfhydrase-like pyridoxal-dependent ACC family enzyme